MCKRCGCGDKKEKAPGVFKRVEIVLSWFLTVSHKAEDTQLCGQRKETEEAENACEMIWDKKENPADRIEPWRCMYCGYENPKGILWCEECGFLGGIKD